MRILFAAATVLFLAAAPAQASMGISCTIDDENAQFFIHAKVTTGMGSPIYGAENELTVSSGEVGADLLTSRFGPDELAQYWFDSSEIRLLFYRERPSEMPHHGYVQLEIRTIGYDEGGFDGRYRLMLLDMERSQDTVYLEGAVECMSG
jgi:hypothetical protein